MFVHKNCFGSISIFGRIVYPSFEAGTCQWMTQNWRLLSTRKAEAICRAHLPSLRWSRRSWQLSSLTETGSTLVRYFSTFFLLWMEICTNQQNKWKVSKFHHGDVSNGLKRLCFFSGTIYIKSCQHVVVAMISTRVISAIFFKPHIFEIQRAPKILRRSHCQSQQYGLNVGCLWRLKLLPLTA